MALYWMTHRDDEMVVVTGKGSITRVDIENYLAGTIREGTKGFAKSIELAPDSAFALDHDDLESVAQSLLAYGKGDRPGPVAIVVHSELNLDMAMLLKQRVGDRPFRIFTSSANADAWLRDYSAFDLAPERPATVVEIGGGRYPGKPVPGRNRA